MLHPAFYPVILPGDVTQRFGPVILPNDFCRVICPNDMPHGVQDSSE
jgi:hypothetical protein